jgi:hypothetical protein
MHPRAYGAVVHITVLHAATLCHYPFMSKDALSMYMGIEYTRMNCMEVEVLRYSDLCICMV